jgi:hypothetical protein
MNKGGITPAFLTSALDGGEWPAPCPYRVTACERTPEPGRTTWSRNKDLASAENRTRTVQPVAYHFTDRVNKFEKMLKKDGLFRHLPGRLRKTTKASVCIACVCPRVAIPVFNFKIHITMVGGGLYPMIYHGLALDSLPIRFDVLKPVFPWYFSLAC